MQTLFSFDRPAGDDFAGTSPDASPPADRGPPPAASDATLVSPPVRASEKPIPPDGFPLFFAGPVASPRTGTDPSAWRPARAAGPLAPGEEDQATQSAAAEIARGEKTKARDILAAIRTLKTIEGEGRQATPGERVLLARFGGFGAVANVLFPNEVLLRKEPDHPFGGYKDAGWQVLGEELKALLTPEEYDSAKGSTYNAFYTSPAVMKAMHQAIGRLGVPAGATVLEPGCGTGNFMKLAPGGMRFIGVERDALSGRIARALHPGHDIRIEPFQESRLPAVDAVIGNPPFADVPIAYRGRKLPLHDFFIAKSLDAVRPGGVLALVTSHFTLDKVNAATREQLAEQADFLGAIRLPSDAFRREGTSVVTDILFLRKRANGQTAQHADPDWLTTGRLAADGAEITVNRYFLNHPDMVLGTWSRQGRLYDDDYSVIGGSDLAEQLAAAVGRLPEQVVSAPAASASSPAEPAFTPPPAEPHIGEGSLFYGEDQVIRQVVNGSAQPVVYGGVLLKANGTPQGRKIGRLIDIKNLARRVLQSQNEGWPEAARAAARCELNLLRDRFVSQFGPINKTTFSQNADGTVIRRMPNLVKFREDPDAMRVMALEKYDEVTGKAEKADILLRDVVGPKPPVTHVASAEDGLLVSLDRKGVVDLAYIAALYGKPESKVIDELGDLIWQDPQSKAWQTADEYLSGNVRAKLKVAEAAGAEYAGNAEALRAVQPEDVLPGDIDANLGAPWIPESDIQAFAAELFGVGPGAIQIGHLKKDAEWVVEADVSATQSVAATSEFGTLSINGTRLLELALNLKPPVIYDPDPDDPDKRVVNQEKTLAAREKQKLIKERFRAWAFADPQRSERLVRLYNDNYNNLRLRQFDGSHLEFPGMNQSIVLDAHQMNGVWRGMSDGNTGLGHVVGGGKTFTMAATGMKLKQAGLIKKPMYVVPNHMLEQFARQFMKLYPNARLLVATKDDLARDRRKLLTAKIASGDWDGIIVTHSSFERIAMSAGFQARFLKEQIAEYEALLLDSSGRDASRAKRNLIKTIEKQKARRQERLKDLLAAEKKDDGLVFDELGVDHIFIDEAHYFKNLETPTKMERVAGVQTGGSERAFDLFMKARYLDELHPGHGVTFATGTPLSNTMVELYTMLRFLDLQGLKERGIDHFDAWAANFCEVIDTMEIAPDGSTLKPRSRLAKFVNMPELQQLFRAVFDVQTADMLPLKRPKLITGKPIVVACPMSDEQRDLQAGLVRRYDRIRTTKVDPREDNALAITTDGNKLALDARMLSPTAPDFAGSKINQMVSSVARIWRESTSFRGTQLIFSDLGVNPTPWGFCVYDEIVEKLVGLGIPRHEIAVIGDADTDSKKQSLFERMRSGSVRVLIGSTQKMGAGTDVQDRLVAKHDLDAPWKPADVEQRDGRIQRQGNMNEWIAIYRYVTEGSFDSYRWQALETKARFIGQVMTGDAIGRRAEDIGGQELSYAEVKAIASGNPAVLTLAQADAELQRLTILRKNHDDEQYLARCAQRDLPEKIARLKERLAALSADAATMAAHEGDPITICGRVCHGDDVLTMLGARLDTMPKLVRDSQAFALGRYRGLGFGLQLYANGAAEVVLEGKTTRHGLLSRDHRGPRAVLNAVERLSASYDRQCEQTASDLAIAAGQLRDHEARLGRAFAHEAYLAELTELRDRLRDGLSQPAPEPGQPTVTELAKRITALKAAHTIDSAPARTERRRLTAEEPVTTRIHRRAQAAAAVEPEASEPVALPFVALAPADDAHPPRTDAVAGPDILPLNREATDFAFQTHNDVVMQPRGVVLQHTPHAVTSSHGRTTMARTRKAGAHAAQESDTTPTNQQPTEVPAEQAQVTGEAATVPGRKPIVTPDPRPAMSASLGDGKRIQLLRSHHYKQMQIRSDVSLDEKYQHMLAEAGWRDRTEEEGIWTKQVPDGMWQPVADAERLFKELANGMRADRGLEAVLEMGAA